jgi:hypothetical protein
MYLNSEICLDAFVVKKKVRFSLIPICVDKFSFLKKNVKKKLVNLRIKIGTKITTKKYIEYQK